MSQLFVVFRCYQQIRLSDRQTDAPVFLRTLIGEHAESILNEVSIKAKCFADAKGLHHRKRNAVDQVVIFIAMAREQAPGFLAHDWCGFFDSD